MPGIFGFVLKDSDLYKESDAIFSRMVSLLHHQDWYVLKSVVNNQYAFGNISTSRINCNLAKVEAFGVDYIVLIDGQIYKIGDILAICLCDPMEQISKAIVEKYLSEGQNGISKIEGNYVIAIFNVNDGELVIFQDRIGPRRIYYADMNDMFVFSSEVKAISCLSSFNKKLNLKGIADYFNYGYLLGDDTFFKCVKAMPSATIIRYQQKEGTFTTCKYWKPQYTARSGDLDVFADEGFQLLSSSIEEKLSFGDSVISPISGGLDSRVILGILKNSSKGVVINPVTYGQTFSDEYKIAMRVCNALQLDKHTLVTIDAASLLRKYVQAVWLSEGMIPMANAHLLLLPSLLGHDHTSLLNGIYGGPTNYSAEYYGVRHIGLVLDYTAKVNDIKHVMSVPTELYRDVFRREFYDVVRGCSFHSIFEELSKYLDVSDEFCNQRDAFFIENRMRRAICQSALYRFFWDEKLPLSNYDLYEFYLSTPAQIKTERSLLKAMIKRHLPKLAIIPDSNTGLNLFDSPSIWNTKFRCLLDSLRYYSRTISRGYLVFFDRSAYGHYHEWLMKDRNTLSFYDLKLNSSAMKECGLFDSSGLQDLFKRVCRGGSGFHHLLRIVTFSIWLELFVHGIGLEDVRRKVAHSCSHL